MFCLKCQSGNVLMWFAHIFFGRPIASLGWAMWLSLKVAAFMTCLSVWKSDRKNKHVLPNMSARKFVYGVKNTNLLWWSNSKPWVGNVAHVWWKLEIYKFGVQFFDIYIYTHITGEQAPGAQTAALNVSKVILRSPCPGFPVAFFLVGSGQCGRFKGDTS